MKEKYAFRESEQNAGEINIKQTSYILKKKVGGRVWTRDVNILFVCLSMPCLLEKNQECSQTTLCGWREQDEYWVTLENAGVTLNI